MAEIFRSSVNLAFEISTGWDTGDSLHIARTATLHHSLLSLSMGDNRSNIIAAFFFGHNQVSL